LVLGRWPKHHGIEANDQGQTTASMKDVDKRERIVKRIARELR